MEEPIPFWFISLCLGLFGACVGSFLNVAIYRIPRGISVNKPARSFCPNCKTPIPWYNNLPMISWLLLRGKSACCSQHISFRYWGVEALTALLFTIASYWAFISFPDFPIHVAILLCLWIAFAITIAFIDAEQMIVHLSQTIWASLIGMGIVCLYPEILLDLPTYTWESALLYSAIGGAVGFASIKVIIELGKLAFGTWKAHYESPTRWELVEPQTEEEEMELHLGEESHPWSMLFHRATDKATFFEGTISIDKQKPIPFQSLELHETKIYMPQTRQEWLIEDITSASGTLLRAEAKREAMGAGDAWIMMMIGCLFGWQAVIFSLAAASFIGIGFAVINKIGIGKPLPFGPCLLLGAAAWFFGGYLLWEWYFNYFGNF